MEGKWLGAGRKGLRPAHEKYEFLAKNRALKAKIRLSIGGKRELKSNERISLGF